MKLIKKLLLGLCILLFSCARNESVMSDYATRIVQVEDCSEAKLIDSTSCRIELMAELQLPKTTKYIYATKMQCIDDKFFILDQKNHTVFAFDSAGNFISRYGERGRSKNEYINTPTDFFVEYNTGNIHVFERDSRRILIFSEDGNHIQTLHLDCWPYSVALTTTGNYLTTFNYKAAGNGIELGIITPNEESVKSILYLQHDYDFVNSNRTSYMSDKFLYHIPNLSDSVLVFYGDTVKEVIKLEFPYVGMPDKIKKQLSKGILEEYKAHRGLTSINDYYETSQLINFSYSLSHVKINCLIDKRNNKQYHSTGAFCQGLFPGNRYCMKDNHIYWLITQDDIGDMSYMIDLCLNDENLKKQYDITHPIIKDILKQKYQLPVILKITLLNE